jgi:kinesin family protein 4/21/27
VDLQKKLKEENEKFLKFKEDRYKDLMMARKQKVRQEALMRKLKNDKVKTDLQLRRKEDELQKQKLENTVKQPK